MFVFALAVVFKLCSIKFIHGDQYRELAEKRTVKDFEIEPNRGNVYSADGSLLATSIPKYDAGKSLSSASTLRQTAAGRSTENGATSELLRTSTRSVVKQITQNRTSV